LVSCNYGCDYCPFAKRSQTTAELALDQQALKRLVNWVQERPPSDRFSIFFTPWGEALIHPWYQRAIAQLTHYPQVVKVAIQTNLSCRLEWVETSNKVKLGLWTTYHPTEVSRHQFVQQCLELEQRHIRFSVGIVGLKAHRAEAQALRQALPDSIYVWVNAYKRQANYYNPSEIADFTAIDPLFGINNQVYPSFGRPCQTGQSVLSVDGDGNLRRCHFIPDHLGNLYQSGFEQALQARPCTNATCRCHIGYVHMPELGLDEIYGSGLLERIPVP
jgi:sulfatase maturation enzyme AslB (radical SAM superfamily)